MLTVKDYSFRYAGSKSYLWEPLSFSVAGGELVIVKGENGSGKTTLLQSVCGIIPKVINGDIKGEIIYRDKTLSSMSLKEIAPEINILFQEPDKQIFMPVVEEEIAFGPENLCLEREEIAGRVSKFLKKFDIEHLRHKKISTLSYGQKKLVALAGLLAMSPSVILIDEFCAGMDDKVIDLAVEYFRELKDEGKIIIAADHHHSFAELADFAIDLS